LNQRWALHGRGVLQMPNQFAYLDGRLSIIYKAIRTQVSTARFRTRRFACEIDRCCRSGADTTTLRASSLMQNGDFQRMASSFLHFRGPWRDRWLLNGASTSVSGQLCAR